jgi:hypothetical protein
MEKRFLRVARGSLVGGVRLGMFTGAFYGIQNLLADVRGVQVYDVFNVVGAGSITAATCGLISESFYSLNLFFCARVQGVGVVVHGYIVFGSSCQVCFDSWLGYLYA